MMLFIAVFAVLLFSQNAFSQEEMQKGKDHLLKADMEFSRLSEEKGSNYAFTEFASDSAVLLRKNSYPVAGKSAIVELLSKHSDASFTLVWKPLFADLAESGELGYTYGTYEVKSTDKNDSKASGSGTYVTIWKKDKDGNWKFVLDAGNEGLGAEKQH